MRRFLLLLAILLCLPTSSALAAAGDFGFEGGSPRQQNEVRSALETTSFDVGIVPALVTVHIDGHGVSHSTPSRSGRG